jgi:hypothetical protein
MTKQPPSRTVYPPLDTLKAVADGLWIVDSGPLRALGLPIPVRMTVVRLQSGEVWLHSPTRYVKALHEALEQIGRIAHLVAPSISHWSFLRDWQDHCPQAITWAAPGLEQRWNVKKSGVTINATLGDQAPADWAAELEQVVIQGGFGASEIAFLHKRSSTLILADLVENLEPEKLSPSMRVLARLAGALAPHGQAPLHYRLVLNRNRKEVARAAQQLLAWAPERVIFAHGRWFERDGTARLRHSLRWLLD